MEDEETETIVVRAPVALKKDLQVMADETERSLSSMVRLLLKEAVIRSNTEDAA